MKIGQLVSLHVELEAILSNKEASHTPRFIYWLKSAYDKTSPIHKNLQESIQGLKSERLLEFEEKRGLLIETIAGDDKISPEDKDKQYKESIEPIKAEYLSEIEDFKEKVKDFEESVLEEEENVAISKVKFADLPSVSLQTMQSLHPFVEAKQQLKQTKDIPFKKIMAISEMNTDNFSNALKYSITDFMLQIADTYQEFVETRKRYQLDENFGQFALEKTQAMQNIKDPDELAKAFDEIHSRFQTLHEEEQKLDAIIKSEIPIEIAQVSIDDLPEEITTAQYEAIDFLVGG